jgi:hypothetical protein
MWLRSRLEQFHYDETDITLLIEGECPPEKTTRKGIVSYLVG